MMSGLPPAKPIMLKERNSMVFLKHGEVDVLDGAFVLVDKNGIRTHIPVGSLACIIIEKETRITHEAIKLAARVGCLIVWVGDDGVRLYSAGQAGGARADKLLYQAKCYLDDTARLNVVRKLYSMRFGKPAPKKRSILQLKSMEMEKVYEIYSSSAEMFKVEWNYRNYKRNEWEEDDIPNRCLSAATMSLYAITESAILAAGYSPAIGFFHSHESRPFVSDIADIFIFDTVVPVAFKIAAQKPEQPERDVRIACRDIFRIKKILKLLIPTIEEVLLAGGLESVGRFAETINPAIPNKEGIGDAGHRN